MATFAFDPKPYKISEKIDSGYVNSTQKFADWNMAREILWIVNSIGDVPSFFVAAYQKVDGKLWEHVL